MKININAQPGTSRENKTGGWRTFKPQINENTCIGCGTCAKTCPEGAIKMVKKNGKTIAQINYDYCKGCQLCNQVCPVKAIKNELEEK